MSTHTQSCHSKVVLPRRVPRSLFGVGHTVRPDRSLVYRYPGNKCPDLYQSQHAPGRGDPSVSDTLFLPKHLSASERVHTQRTRQDKTTSRIRSSGVGRGQVEIQSTHPRYCYRERTIPGHGTVPKGEYYRLGVLWVGPVRRVDDTQRRHRSHYTSTEIRG